MSARVVIQKERGPTLTMQNSISFSIESIISRIDPPKQKEDENKASLGIPSRGPLSAMQNLVELTPRGIDFNYLEETVPASEMAREKLDKHFHGENVMDHPTTLPSSKSHIYNFVF